MADVSVVRGRARLVITGAGWLSRVEARRLHRDAADTLADLQELRLHVVFDARNVTMIDAAGLGQLVALNKHLKDNGATLTIINLSEDLERLFRMTSLGNVIDVEFAAPNDTPNEATAEATPC